MFSCPGAAEHSSDGRGRPARVFLRRWLGFRLAGGSALPSTGGFWRGCRGWASARLEGRGCRGWASARLEGRGCRGWACGGGRGSARLEGRGCRGWACGGGRGSARLEGRGCRGWACGGGRGSARLEGRGCRGWACGGGRGIARSSDEEPDPARRAPNDQTTGRSEHGAVTGHPSRRWRSPGPRLLGVIGRVRFRAGTGHAGHACGASSMPAAGLPRLARWRERGRRGACLLACWRESSRLAATRSLAREGPARSVSARSLARERPACRDSLAGARDAVVRVGACLLARWRERGRRGACLLARWRERGRLAATLSLARERPARSVSTLSLARERPACRDWLAGAREAGAERVYSVAGARAGVARVGAVGTGSHTGELPARAADDRM